MTALNDSERAAKEAVAAVAGAQPPRGRTSWYPSWLPSRRFVAAVVAIGGMQLLATMDSTVAIVALPKIQNELDLSDAGDSGVIAASVLTFGGLMLLGGRLDYIDGRAVPTIVYRRRTHVINLFVMQSSGAGTKVEKVRGFNVRHWTWSDLDFWAISDVSPDELQEFGEKFESSLRTSGS